MRILVAEDERHLNDVIRKRLADAGYAVDSVYTGTDALDYLLSVSYDLAILDVMMPAMNGFEVLRLFHEKGGNTPVLFLTARDSIEDRVEGLDSGADDYLVKPFDFTELLARIRVLLRRREKPSSRNILSISNLSMDISKHEVKRGGRHIELSSKEFAILEYMMRNRDMVLSRDQILSHAWNLDYEGESNVIDVYIRYLRKKIDENESVKLIHTVRGSGYVLREERGEA